MERARTNWPSITLYLPVGIDYLPVGSMMGRLWTHPQAPPVSATPSPEQEVHTRLRLLEAAVQIFDRKGYAAASVREIAEAAGVTKPVLYYHFGSKEGLLRGRPRPRRCTTSRPTLDAAVARTGAARERLVRLCEDIYAHVREERAGGPRGPRRVPRPARRGAPRSTSWCSSGGCARPSSRIVTDGQQAGELRGDAAGRRGAGHHGHSRGLPPIARCCPSSTRWAPTGFVGF